MPRSQHEHEKEDNIFLSAALAEMLKLPRSTKWGGSWNELSLHVDLLKMYKCAEKLEVPSLVDISEPTRSHYGGKNVPLARIVVKQPLLPELLAELPNICSNCPDSNRSPILVEALVVAHLCPGSKSQLSAASSRHLTPPTQPGQFPSAHAPASQAELGLLTPTCGRTWQSMPFYLCIQRVSVQATDKVMATLLIQERDGSASPT